ncbi:MAG: hypothetical protein J6Y37_16875 [Paludibacteraceae bacterium]|nr:hypothetical protein [Paludibacteraceae bacterium]
MGIMNYEIGGNEVKQTSSEGIANIPQNRTLFVGLLTADEPVSPEAVANLKTVEDVYAKFQPNVDVEFENAEGQTVKENFRFQNTADFQVKRMTENSPFLGQLSVQKDFYEKLVKLLRTNKVLQKALENPDSRQAMVDALCQLRNELKQTSTI